MLEEDVIAPEGWTIEPLSACVDVLDSRRKPVNSKERAARPGPVPYYGATGQVGWIDDFLFDEELVLLGEDGAPFLDKSKPIAYVIDGKSWVNNHAHVLRARYEVTSNRYVKHYLDSFDFTHRVQGSTRDKLTQGSMNTIPVLLASRDLQDALVRTVDSIGSMRESASTHLVAARRAIERFRQVVLAAACSGRLTADWREANQEVTSTRTVLDRRGQLEPLVETPDEWVWCQLADIADLRGGVQKGAAIKAGVPTREVPYLRVANVQRGWLDLTEIKTIIVPDAKVAELRLEPGDVLFNEGGDRDKLGRGWIWEGQIDECIHQNHVFRARLRYPDFEPRFFSWFGNAIGAAYFIDRGKQTVNLASLNMTALKALPVPVPSPAEQQEIVKRAEQLLSLVEVLAKRIESARKRVDRSSQAVLAKAFRGELAVAEAGGVDG